MTVDSLKGNLTEEKEITDTNNNIKVKVQQSHYRP
jgi:hypothetical protein